MRRGLWPRRAAAEGVFFPGDLGRAREDDADDVEPSAVPFDCGSAGVIAGGAFEAGALLRIDGRIGRAVIGGGAGLYFHERERVSVPNHEVDLTHPGSRAVVAGNHGATAASQVTMRDVFADSAV